MREDSITNKVFVCLSGCLLSPYLQSQLYYLRVVFLILILQLSTSETMQFNLNSPIFYILYKDDV